MLKISKTKSLMLSLVLAALFFIACIFTAFIVPQYINIFMNMKNAVSMNIIDYSDKIVLMVITYLIIAVMMLADIFLFYLLLRVRKELVFTDLSVALVRSVSWCCVLLGVLFFVLGLFFTLSFGMAFACVFLGLCLRVVKNVIEQAVSIKNENDLTV